jgi:hypothetical protein
VWVEELGSVVRVDAATGRVLARVRTPGVGENGHIAAGYGSIWATAGLELGGGGDVYRIDPRTDRVIATIRVGGVAMGIAAGGGSVWVTRPSRGPSQGPGSVVRIDPQTDRVVGAAIVVGLGLDQISEGSGAFRINPATGKVVTVAGTDATLWDSFAVGSMAFGDGSLWTVGNDILARWDPQTDRVITLIRIPRAEYVAIAHRTVWVLAAPQSSSPTLFYPVRRTAALWQVDATRNRIVGGPLRLNGPIALATAGTAVWVIDYSYTNNRATLLRALPAHA